MPDILFFTLLHQEGLTFLKREIVEVTFADFFESLLNRKDMLQANFDWQQQRLKRAGLTRPDFGVCKIMLQTP
jgi:uncharacterized protein YllA (UPF0747 family)